MDLVQGKVSRGCIESKDGVVDFVLTYDQNLKITSLCVDNPWFHFNSSYENNKGLPDCYIWFRENGPIDYEFIWRLKD